MVASSCSIPCRWYYLSLHLPLASSSIHSENNSPHDQDPDKTPISQPLKHPSIHLEEKILFVCPSSISITPANYIHWNQCGSVMSNIRHSEITLEMLSFLQYGKPTTKAIALFDCEFFGDEYHAAIMCSKLSHMTFQSCGRPSM